MEKTIESLPSIDPKEAARLWYLRLEEEAGDDQTLDLFEEWVSADRSHRDAFNDVVDFWSRIDGMAEIQQIRESGADFLREYSLAPEGAEKKPPEDNIVISLRQKRSDKSIVNVVHGWRKWAVAAMVLIVCSVGINFYNNYLPSGTYGTATGERKVIQLPDGSTIYLNTNSRLSVDFSDNVRKVYLRKGEARFDVAKDEKRPFIVETSRGDVRAVGTSFNIYDSDEMVEIIVFEGSVKVGHKKNSLDKTTDMSQPSPMAVLVTEGERIAAFDKNLSIVRVANDLELLQKNAWRNGKLIFRGQKLSEVIREMSRYTNRKIIIADDSLNEMRLGGVFDVDDFDAFFHAIEDAFPVRVIRFTPYVAVIFEA